MNFIEKFMNLMEFYGSRRKIHESCRKIYGSGRNSMDLTKKSMNLPKFQESYQNFMNAHIFPSVSLDTHDFLLIWGWYAFTRSSLALNYKTHRGRVYIRVCVYLRYINLRVFETIYLRF